MEFEILCIDNNRAVERRYNTKAFILAALCSSYSLWGNSPKEIISDSIIAKDESIRVIIEDFDMSSNPDDPTVLAYRVTVSSECRNIIEPFRSKLLHELKHIGFTYISILFDEVSRDIGKQLYPYINDVENRLRRFVEMVLMRRLGVGYLEKVLGADILFKIDENLKHNDIHFLKDELVHSRITLLQFDDLGNVVYGNSIFKEAKAADILKVVKAADEMDALKRDLFEGNLQKYFNDYFDQKFRAKWVRLEKLRNRVAHNGLFVESDIIECETLCGAICQIIEKAYGNYEKSELSISEMKTLIFQNEDSQSEENDTESIESPAHIDSITEPPEQQDTKIIDERTLLNTLYNTQNTHRFVARKHFIERVLGNARYDIAHAWGLLETMEEGDNNKIEKYQEPNPYGHDTTCIRLTEYGLKSISH